jgi:dynein heavy chain
VQGNPKFLELVSAWQKKLGTVDSVMTVWGDVSKKWSMLESVFVGRGLHSSTSQLNLSRF